MAASQLAALGFTEKARLMPLLVGIPGTMLGIAQLLSEIRQATHDGNSEEVTGAELVMLGWVVAFFAGILCFGFVYAAPLLVLAFMIAGKKESVPIGVMSAVATWAVLYIFFEQTMEIPLFQGLIVERLIG